MILVLVENAVSHVQVFVWFKELRNSPESVEDELGSERWIEVQTDKQQSACLQGWQLAIQMLADDQKIN